MSSHVVALSGGKDSTALALRLAEVEPRDYIYLCTPTGDELPEMVQHWEKLEAILGKPILRLRARADLAGLIREFEALPNWRQRWCTRMLKIEPCLAYLRSLKDPILYVGLRADEEERQGIYSADVTSRFPLREWGWGVKEVWGYLKDRGVPIPRRTDCARCYDQGLKDWYRLWQEHPNIWADAEQQEAEISALRGKRVTFRGPGRDDWPAPLVELRAEFERGRVPRGIKPASLQMVLIDEEEPGACRVCSL